MRSLSIVIAVTLLASCSGMNLSAFNRPNSESPLDRNGPYYEYPVF